jgi:hypothetical protein
VVRQDEPKVGGLEWGVLQCFFLLAQNLDGGSSTRSCRERQVGKSGDGSARLCREREEERREKRSGPGEADRAAPGTWELMPKIYLTPFINWLSLSSPHYDFFHSYIHFMIHLSRPHLHAHNRNYSRRALPVPVSRATGLRSPARGQEGSCEPRPAADSATPAAAATASTPSSPRRPRRAWSRRARCCSTCAPR